MPAGEDRSTKLRVANCETKQGLKRFSSSNSTHLAKLIVIRASGKIFDSGLQRVINAWRDLPTNLKAAIISIVGPNSLSHRQLFGRSISEA